MQYKQPAIFVLNISINVKIWNQSDFDIEMEMEETLPWSDSSDQHI